MIFTLQDIPGIATELLKKDARIYTFSGSLGAGKTTLIQQMLRQLGVAESIQSPTYTYVCRYQAQDGRKILHFDLYRLRSVDDFIQAGFDEYLYDDSNICFIEWPEIIVSLTQARADVVVVMLEYCTDTTRSINSM